MYGPIYIVTNIFATYTIYKFMRIFFNHSVTDRRIEALSYLGYFTIITTIYFAFPIPAVMIASNIVLFLMLTLNYKSSIKQKLGAVALIYIILMTIESIFVIFSNYYSLSMVIHGEYSSVTGIITIRLVSFIVLLLIGNFKSIKYGRIIPFSYWLCIIFVPVASLVLLVMFLNFPTIARYQALSITVIIFAMNFFVFYLYDVVSVYHNNHLHQILLEKQNNYYHRQFETMKESLLSMSTLKHDFKNHLTAIYTLLQNREVPQAVEHLSQMMHICEFDKKYADSGNVSIDSILNFKLNEAIKNDIVVSLDLSIPMQLDMPSFDMAVILGNLLDNAICANLALSHNRYINVAVRFDKGRLLIKIENPYEGILREQDGKLLTTKTDHKHHGIGMDSIRNTLKKYDGILTVDHSDNIFRAQILMYIE